MKNKITIIITAIALISSNVWAEEIEAKTTIQDDIRKLMEVTGAMELGNQMFAQIMPILKQNSPDVPDEIWAEFFAELDTDRLLELTIPVYEKHFTHAEIKELLAFYETPIGKKLISVQPEILKDSMAASQVWGQEIYQKVSKKLDAYYKNSPPHQSSEPPEEKTSTSLHQEEMDSIIYEAARLFDKQAHEQAFQLYQKAKEMGDKRALPLLASCYLSGAGTETNITKAQSLCRSFSCDSNSESSEIIPIEMQIEVSDNNVIDCEGLIYGEDDALDELISYITSLSSTAETARSPFVVKIEFHPNTSHHRILNLLDACSQVGVESLSIMIEKD